MRTSNFDEVAKEWRPQFILFPRVGIYVTRYGARRRFMLPGRYMTRHSTTFKSRIYTRAK